MFAPSCPSLPPPLPRPWPGRAAVTVLRADRVTAGPLAEYCQGPLHRRHLPARARRHTHREGTGGRGTAGWPRGREARWESAPPARVGGGAGHAPRGTGPLPEPAQSRGAAPPGLEPRLAGAAEQRSRETGRGRGRFHELLESVAALGAQARAALLVAGQEMGAGMAPAAHH